MSFDGPVLRLQQVHLGRILRPVDAGLLLCGSLFTLLLAELLQQLWVPPFGHVWVALYSVHQRRFS